MSEQETSDRIADELFREATFMFEVQDFLKTNIGRYLVARSDADIERAMQALATANPEDAKLIRDLQTKIRVASSWQDWLADAITEGKNAHQQLVQMGA